MKAGPQVIPIAIEGAVIHTVSKGTLLEGTIWFEQGVLKGIVPAGQAADLPDGTLVLDGKGRHVYPGLIAPFTSLGLQEISSIRPSIDLRELGDATPEALALTAINPDSTVLPVTRSNGVLVAGVFPQGGLVAGRASVIQLDGWTNASLAIVADAGLVVDWPAQAGDNPFRRRRAPVAEDAGGGGDRTARQRRQIDELFAAARAWSDARSADPATSHDVRFAAMEAVVRGRLPVFLLADDLEQIESGLQWAHGRGLRPIVVGGRDSLLCKDLLLRHDVPVILGGTHPLPRRADSPFSERFELPAALHQAGVRFCLASGESFYNERNLPYAAATAVAWGLDPQAALAAITLRPAQILGIADRLGSLEVGKDATLLVTDGPLFELSSRVERAFLGGRQLDLSNKQIRLAEKYRARYRQGEGR